jgi:hypothetical protein
MKFFKTVTGKTNKTNASGLFIANQQLSWVISVLLLFGVITFVAGYFWGQQRALDTLVSKVEEESFADRISYSLYTMYERDASEFEDVDTQQDAASVEEDATVDVSSSLKEKPKELQVQVATLEKESKPLVQASNNVFVEQSNEEEVVNKDKIFVAPLAGFGTLHAASIFARRVRKYDPSVQVKTRVSKTPKGKKIAWYQAVTGEFEKREKLEKIIEQVKKQEHIKEVEIIEKRKAVRT